MNRCSWCGNDPLYVKYHDQEWGVPIKEDRVLFEFLILETFQAGLSWITVLKKRENFRKAFDNFNYKKIAHYQQDKIHLLLQDSGIIRNKLKINAAVSNAQSFLKIQEEYGSFSSYLWAFVENKPIKNNFAHIGALPASTPLSVHISKALKKKGFKFVGATVVYAYMQAIGMVNDHLISCFRHTEV